MYRFLALAIVIAGVLTIPPVFAESGIAARPSNSTCLAPPRPDTGPATVAAAFPNVAKGDGLSIAYLPGDASNVYLLDRAGIVYRFPNDPAATTKTIVLDVRSLFAGTTPEGQSGMMSMAFHPDFASTGELYVSYTVPGPNRTSYLARYRSTDGGRTFSASSGEVLMALPQEGIFHGVGQVMFGLDGYLYVVFGDGGPRRLVQDPNAWYGKILRIDVDSGSPYGIPPDNPFASGGGAPEVYALGLRNAWSFSQDEVTGEIWVGDVGGSTWEEVNKLVKGGNYGWPIKEGFHCFESATCDSTGLIDPVYEYSHDNGCAIIGGHVYRGSSFPALTGKYIFGDNCSGEIFSLEETASGPIVNLLVSSGLALRTISESSSSELLMIAGGNNRIQQLVPDTSGGADPAFPVRLSETGCVDPANPTSVVEGVIPYEVNTALWSDGADKRRWMAIPDGSQITVGPDGDFEFPIGSVLLKEFSVNETPFETRLFVRHADGGWAGYTYRWNEALTDAELVPPGGLADQEVGPLTWSYPSRAQCLDCHSAAAGRTLGPETAQLNGPMIYPSGIVSNQLETLSSIGMFANDLGGTPDSLPALAHVGDLTRSLDDRARSYLHANCAGCHRPEGPGQGPMDFRYHLTFEQTSTCNREPEIGDLGVPGAKILVPGNPDASVMSLRMHALDGNRMPPLGTRLVDLQGTSVIDAWIGSISSCAGPDTGVTITLPAVADSFTRGAILWTDQNFGGKSFMRVERSGTKMSFVRFELPALTGPLTGAVLSVAVDEVGAEGTVTVRKVMQPWTELGITASNLPDLGTDAIATLPVQSSDVGNRVEVDVSSLVADWVADPGSNFGLALVHAGSTKVTFLTRESGQSPELTLNVGPGDENTPPDVVITSPASGFSSKQGEPIALSGLASDDEDGDISAFINWSSDLDGPLGTGNAIVANGLSLGVHQITATSTDLGGLSSSASVSISVTENTGGSTSLSLAPIADSFTRDAATWADSNFGTKSFMRVETSGDKASFVRFDLQGVTAPLVTAVLRLKVDSVLAEGTVSVHRVTQEWTETGITANNEPGFDSAAATFAVSLADIGSEVEVDVTALVSGWLSDPASNYGLVLRHAGSAKATFLTRETPEGPSLDLELE